MELFTVEEVARLLKVSDSFVHAEITKGRMPHTRLGTRKYIRVSPTQLTAYLESKEHNNIKTDLMVPCCDHCGCPADERVGHDDTCRFGCNDSVVT